MSTLSTRQQDLLYTYIYINIVDIFKYILIVHRHKKSACYYQYVNIFNIFIAPTLSTGQCVDMPTRFVLYICYIYIVYIHFTIFWYYINARKLLAIVNMSTCSTVLTCQHCQHVNKICFKHVCYIYTVYNSLYSDIT